MALNRFLVSRSQMGHQKIMALGQRTAQSRHIHGDGVGADESWAGAYAYSYKTLPIFVDERNTLCSQTCPVFGGHPSPADFVKWS